MEQQDRWLGDLAHQCIDGSDELRLSLIETAIHTHPVPIPLFSASTIQERIVALSLCLIQQIHLLPILNSLVSLDQETLPIGGLIGYHALLMELLQRPPSLPEYEPPPYTEGSFSVDGIDALPTVGLVVVAGGLATRLAWEAALPAGLFPYHHHHLIDHLFDDLVAWEGLYEARHGRSITIPMVCLGSQELHEHLASSLPPSRLAKLRYCIQPLVPCVDRQGRWVMEGGSLKLQPSGHGAVWMALKRDQLFSWFADQGVSYLLFRQINNPISSCNKTLLSFLDTGIRKQATFGFLGVPRDPEGAEGLLVKTRIQEKEAIANIEYMYAPPRQGGIANTNILFADLHRIQSKIHPFDGPILNIKGPYGRIETLMQQMSSHIPISETFIQVVPREEAFAAIKTQHREACESLEKALDQEQVNHHTLLGQCQVLFDGSLWYHPALGPLYTLIKQKIERGSWKGTVKLEIRDLVAIDLMIEQGLTIHGLQGGVVLHHTVLSAPCSITLGRESELILIDTHVEEAMDLTVPDGEIWLFHEGSWLKLTGGRSWKYRLFNDMTLSLESTLRSEKAPGSLSWWKEHVAFLLEHYAHPTYL